MKRKNISVCVKEPGKPWAEAIVPNKLEYFQMLVGGNIETITGPVRDVLYIVNEEGKIKGLRPNMMIPGDVLCGTIICTGISEEDFCGCPYCRYEMDNLTKEDWIKEEER